MSKIIITGVLLLMSLNSFADNIAKAKYTFANPQQAQLFNNLLPNLRCLVCQNESLADSNAPLAEDLRKEVYQQVLAGKSQAEIISYLTNRYGEFILFKPPVESKTYILWFLPFLLIIIGITFVGIIARKHKNQKVTLNNQQRQLAENLLREVK